MTEHALFGGAAELFLADEREVVIAGGARTGKTNGVLVKAKYEAETYPGWRQLFVRMTRRSLSESVLPDWENKILGRHHPMLGGRQREGRSTYQHPNGSTVILGGMDDPAGFLSAELDSIKFFQAEQQPDPKGWDMLLSRLSGSAGPYQQMIADVNPGGRNHWILRRAKELLCLRCGTPQTDGGAARCEKCGATELGRMRWIDSRHEDNPLFFDHKAGKYRKKGTDYIIGVLGRLRGVARRKYLKHEWCSEEGQILEEFDPAVHLLSGHVEQQVDRSWLLHVKHPDWVQEDPKQKQDPMRTTPVRLDWFGAGVDWGYHPDPGVIQVWGYDRFSRRFLVAEVYRLNWQREKWADVAEELWREFDIRYFACDPSRNADIDYFNMRLTGARAPIGAAQRTSPAIAIGADNTLRRQKPDLAGIDLMRWGLKDPKGIVRTFLLRDCTRYGRDPELREASRPTCLEEEIPMWVYAKKKSTDELLEKPDDSCDEHGCDANRYEMGEGWGRRLAAKLKSSQFPEGSMGQIMRHDEKMSRAKRFGE